MATLIDEILTKLHQLPEPKLKQVLGFVDTINQPNPSAPLAQSQEPLLQIAGILSGQPLPSADIDTELYGSSSP